MKNILKIVNYFHGQQIGSLFINYWKWWTLDSLYVIPKDGKYTRFSDFSTSLAQAGWSQDHDYLFSPS